METKYKLGDLVYLITDCEQLPRIITAIKITLGGGLTYSLSNGTQDTDHYEAEISSRKNIEIVLGIKDLNYGEE